MASADETRPVGRVSVRAESFDLAAEMQALGGAGTGGVGGIGCFVGMVRGDGRLSALTLEHYPGMTERALARIAEAAIRRFDLLGCTVIHRIGRLPVGAPIVLVLAAAAHRGAALDATAFLIDWLKTQAPFWKREEFADGSQSWVETRAADDAAAARWS